MDKAKDFSAASKKEIALRAEKALYAFDNSKPNQIDIADVLYKVNEALRLIKELASEQSNSPRFF